MTTTPLPTGVDPLPGSTRGRRRQARHHHRHERSQDHAGREAAAGRFHDLLPLREVELHWFSSFALEMLR